MKPAAEIKAPISARRSVACAALAGKIYLFAGVGANGTESILDVSNDLWCFDPDTQEWHRLDAEATIPKRIPWPSVRRCCGFAPNDECLYLWGGSGLATGEIGETTYTFLNDLWVFRPTDNRWRLLEPSDDFRVCPFEDSDRARPVPRYTPVWHIHEQTGLLFGGYTEDRLGPRKMNDLWLWEISSHRWRRVPHEGKSAGYALDCDWPGIRYGAMSAIDEHALYLCGGFSHEDEHIDVWRRSWAAEQWECLSPEDGRAGTPPPRYSAACATHGGGIWIFGGRSRRYPKLNYNDTWRFDLASRRWENIEPLDDRNRYDSAASRIGYHAKSASSVIGRRWYLWGGEGLHGHVSDMWYFDFQEARWQMCFAARQDDPLFW